MDSNSALSYQEQTALVADLRRSLRDPETWNDGRVLLERLRKRQDMFAQVAEEIDELRASSKPSASVYSRSPARQSRDKATPVKRGVTGPPPPLQQQNMTTQERRRGAKAGVSVGAFLGFIIGLLMSVTFQLTGDYMVIQITFFLLIYGAAGAISGAITGPDRNAIIYAFAGSFIGFFAYYLVFGALTYGPGVTWVWGSGILFGSLMGLPLGSIVGSIIFVTIRRKGDSRAMQ